MTFAHPIWLLLPLAVVPAAWLSWTGHRRRAARLAARFPAGLRLPPAGIAWGRYAWRFALLAFLGLALARPQWGDEATVEVHSGRDILLVMDTSRSMQATDVAPNRIERAKMASLDLLQSLPAERVGIVAFAGSAYPVAPLTTDHDAIRETIVGLDTAILPVAGTNLAPAIEAAADAFKDAPNRRRALVLFTDGEDLEGEWKDVVDLAKKNRMVVLSFAIGTEAGSLLPDPKAEGGFIRDAAGRPVLSKRDMTSLRALAEATGGLAMPMEAGTPVAATVEETLATLERSESEKKTVTTAAERFQWPLAAALVVLPFCLFGGTRRRRARTGRLPVLPAAATTLLSLGAFFPAPGSAASTPDLLSQAARAHLEGRYDESIRLGAGALLDRDPRRQALASFNIANSLYEEGRVALPRDKPTADDMRKTLRDWEDALGHYDESLALRHDPRTSANHAVVAKAAEDLRQQLRQQEQKEEDQRKQDQQQQQQQQQEKDQQQQQQQQGAKDKEDQQGGGGQPQDQDRKAQGHDTSDTKDEGGKDEPGKPKDEAGDQKDQSGKDGQEPQDGKDRQAQDQASPGKDNQEGEPRDASSQDGTTRPMQPGEEGQVGGARLVVGPDGRLKIPEDPKERARLLEMIRRNLKQRSMEDRSVRLIPPDADRKPASRKTW